jgi:magnesium chelatase subunit H
VLKAAGLQRDDQRWRWCAPRATNACWPRTRDRRLILRALDGRFIRPAPGGDLLRTPAVLPTGRNLHGFDPFRIPSAFAVQDGARRRAPARAHAADGNPLPESVAMVLWGTDNLKTKAGRSARRWR